MASLLSPLQLGFGITKGAEAVVHAARSYLADIKSGKVLLKLDFQNAFNSVQRDKMLHSVLEKAPSVFLIAFCAYSSPSFLFYGKNPIYTSEGVQQGDPPRASVI